MVLEIESQRQDNLPAVFKADGDTRNPHLAGTPGKAGDVDVGCAWREGGGTVHIKVGMIEQVVKLGAKLQFHSFPPQWNIFQQGCVLIVGPGRPVGVAGESAIERSIYGDFAGEGCRVGDAGIPGIINLVERDIEKAVG